MSLPTLKCIQSKTELRPSSGLKTFQKSKVLINYTDIEFSKLLLHGQNSTLQNANILAFSILIHTNSTLTVAVPGFLGEMK